MNVIFTCGGTAGHVNPALALAGYMKKKHPDVNILFVGTPTGMERELIVKAGYDFRGIEIGGFERRLNWENIRYNMGSVVHLLTAGSKARKLLRTFRPDLVIGTGGYASYPMVKYAAKAGIPTAVHESNMIPGLTTKTLENYADCVMVGFEDCRRHYKHPEKIKVTGTPVRGDFFELTHEEARDKLGLTDGRPLVVSFWGSLGASSMNREMLDYFHREKEAGFPFHHIHAVGAGSWDFMSKELAAQGLTDCPALDIRKYIDDMAVVMRAADLVICRAGASTISEITALAIPTIIVPSPYVANNHQVKNATLLHEHGGACMVQEDEATGEKLYRTTQEILSDPARQERMHRGMKELGILDATDRIYDTVMALLK
ncbi:MAG: undecaprenyldiphospho-muramoylpentapeptide beta-N-acetylglucosaminyltransferase [Clostridiales bacterium]|nr:undecaprenyldiphospho-muramoylpentapeptide beta-N-acetylglucosaminyltransferase [Candidatus Cacconaster stercorequi]